MKISQLGSALFLGALFLSGAIANARYVVSDYMNKGIDPNKRTHVIVAGKGTDMGLQFHMSAASQARKILDVNPNDQVVLVAVLDDGKGFFADDSDERRLETSMLMFNVINKNNSQDMQHANAASKFYTDVEDGTKVVLQQWGFASQEDVNKDLDGDELVRILSRFNQIASLNIYCHSTAYYGLILSGIFNRLDPEDVNDANILRQRFTSDAYAWFHGCNNGILGMKFTKAWGIPVANSYTSTAFQELFKTPTGEMKFLHSYEKNYPAGSKRMGVNPLSFAKTYTCDKVPCVRMMPDNYGYHGIWGEFTDGGLGFYKFSCHRSIDPNHCKAGMARGLVNHVSNVYLNYKSDLATFKKVAQDYLCPAGLINIKKNYSYQSCVDTLERSLTDSSVTLDTFASKSLQCDRQSCQASIDCQKVTGMHLLIPHSCTLTNRHNQAVPITTQVQEYRDLVAGFYLMKQEMGLPVQ
jgi:hypothetical protein